MSYRVLGILTYTLHIGRLWISQVNEFLLKKKKFSSLIIVIILLQIKLHLT